MTSSKNRKSFRFPVFNAMITVFFGGMIIATTWIIGVDAYNRGYRNAHKAPCAQACLLSGDFHMKEVKARRTRTMKKNEDPLYICICEQNGSNVTRELAPVPSRLYMDPASVGL